jgi:hypothetical protein
MWIQGVRSNYRRAYWRFFWLIIRNWARQPAKSWMGILVLLSAHHFLNYARQVVCELEGEIRTLEEAHAEGECRVPVA